MPADSPSPIAVLFSGGIDSAYLVGKLLAEGRSVQPIYVASGLVWQQAELAAARGFLSALKPRQPKLAELVVLDMPLADVFADHWCVTGRAVPDAATADEAVFLPARNPLLLIKSRLWCQTHGISELAIGALAGNPFPDATDDFLASFAALLDRASAGRVRFTRPLGAMTKADVMRAAHNLPLERTFSCLAPVGNLHCGECNKCAERMAAFRSADRPDASYATVHAPR